MRARSKGVVVIAYSFALAFAWAARTIGADVSHTFARSAMYSLNPLPASPEIADAIADTVASDGALFEGRDGSAKSIALMTAIAYRESNFDNHAIGDSSRSVCFGQVLNGARTLLDDAHACAREVHRILKWSVWHSRRWPVAGYARGPNGPDMRRGRELSDDRMALARWLMRAWKR